MQNIESNFESHGRLLLNINFFNNPNAKSHIVRRKL